VLTPLARLRQFSILFIPNPRRKRTAKDRLISTRIPTEMDEKENDRESRKKKCNLPTTWS